MENFTNITYNLQLIYEEPSCFERLRKLPQHQVQATDANRQASE